MVNEHSDDKMVRPQERRQPITILIPSELREEENQILERLRADERIDHYETVRVSKAGTRVEVSLSISAVKDATGRIVGFSKIARDITQRKRTEEALRESQERFELAAQAGKIYAYESRLPTATVLRSSEYAKILGLTEPERFTYQQFLDGIHPTDRSAFLEAVTALTPPLWFCLSSLENSSLSATVQTDVDSP